MTLLRNEERVVDLGLFPLELLDARTATPLQDACLDPTLQGHLDQVARARQGQRGNGSGGRFRSFEDAASTVQMTVTRQSKSLEGEGAVGPAPHGDSRSPWW